MTGSQGEKEGVADRLVFLGARSALGAVLNLGLYLLSQADYLLFHSVVEVAGIAVAFAIFLLVWNTRHVGTDLFFLLIGVSFLFIGSVDLIHTLAYKGMGIFPGNGADLPTQLWIGARYFQSAVFLIAALLIGRSLTGDRTRDLVLFMGGCAAATGLLFASIFAWQTFPHAFLDESGLTPFKIASEYVISLVMLATIGLLVLRRDHFDRTVWQYLVLAQLLLIAGELAFTSYASVYGFMNMLGHLLRLGSVYFFYEAIVVVGLTRPTDLLFRELSRREAELRQKEGQLRLFIENTPAAVAMFDREMRYLATSRRWLTDYHLGDAELVGRRHDEVFPDLPEAWHAVYRRSLDGVVERRDEDLFVRADGSREWVRWESHPWYDTEGNIGGITVFSEVITDRKRAEDALRRSEQHYRSLVEFSPDAIFVNRDNRIEYVNPAALELFGASAPDQVLGKSPFDIFHPDYHEVMRERIGALREGSPVELIHEQIVRLDGTVREVEVAALPFDDDRGRAIEVILRDVTERRRAEHELVRANAELGAFNEELTSAQEELCAINDELRTREEQLLRQNEELRALNEELTAMQDELQKNNEELVAAERTLNDYVGRLRTSNEELQRFAYVASHDLQEPLRSIVSFSQLLVRRYRGRLDADADDYLGFIVDGGRRMQRLIQDLLQVSRVETNAKPFVPTEMGEVVADALRLLETALQEAGGTVVVGPMPRVLADRSQVEQVVANLVGNAIKYRRPGVAPRVLVSAACRGEWWEFAIADNGIGIEGEYFDRIFEMFRRLHTNDEYEGTGIGLAVVRKIVERHGGTIRVESVPGKGSTFYFTLRRAP